MNRQQPLPAVDLGPDFFTGISLVVDQIDDDVRNDLPRLLQRVVTAHRAKDAVALKLATEAYGKHLSNMIGVADLVTRQCISNINRRPRA